RVEGDVLLPSRALNRADDVASDAQLGEGPKGRRAGGKIADRLVKPDHTLLKEIIIFGALQKVGPGPYVNELLVLMQEVIDGVLVASLSQGDGLFVGHAGEVHFRPLAGLTRGQRSGAHPSTTPILVLGLQLPPYY